MKILVVCQYYYPEPFRINDLCEELVKRGHEVSVVTGEPNYPEGNIYQGYENHAHSDEIINGVKVHRCPIIPRATGTLHRFLNYYSYPREAKKYVLSDACNGFDVVFVNQLSPVMMALPAIAYKKKYRKPVVMYCLDLWPESLVAGGITRTSPIYKYYSRVSKKIYQQMDRILITSRMFRGYLKKQFGIKDDVIEYLPQYAEGFFDQKPYKTTDTFDFMLAGNIGVAQSVETAIKAAEKLKDDKRIRFHIVGSGIDLDRLQKMAEGLDNVIFYGRKPVEEMPDYYAKADAMLVTLKSDPVLSLTLPGKVQSYMAVGKPIIGAIDGEAAEIIEAAQCGYCGPADDANSLANNIVKFIHSEDKKQMGLNARFFYEQHFSKEVFMDKIDQVLSDPSLN